jgi:excisionase family DNA binding protein
MSATQEQLLYPIPEAARLVALSRATLYKVISRGDIRTVRIGGSVRIKAEELRRFVESLNGEETP